MALQAVEYIKKHTTNEEILAIPYPPIDEYDDQVFKITVLFHLYNSMKFSDFVSAFNLKECDELYNRNVYENKYIRVQLTDGWKSWEQDAWKENNFEMPESSLMQMRLTISYRTDYPLK